jgi:polar amino acid transport system substrate-binding protein
LICAEYGEMVQVTSEIGGGKFFILKKLFPTRSSMLKNEEKKMKKKRLFLTLIASLVVFSLALTGCAAGQQETIQIATDATWPPFEYVDETTKEIIGFDIDLMKAIAEAEGLDVEFVNVNWDSLLAGMAQCQFDASISAMTITDERKAQFNFTEPYFAAGQIVTVVVDNTDIAGKDSLVGKTVGAQLGTTGEIFVGNMEGVTLKNYDDISFAFQDLMNGQIDAVVADNPLALGYIGQNPDKLKAVGDVFTDEFYGIAVCNTDTELLGKLNSGLAKVKADGVVDELTVKWIKGGGE